MTIKKENFSTKIGEKELSIEISSMAKQANSAVLAKCGETIVLVTVVMPNKDSNANYMPLRVDYEEKFYAAGKIIGSRFIRREGRPSEEAILSGRLVDRAVRPLFDQRIRREIQVVVTVLSIDEENDPDFVGLVGASAALAISDVPWNGPVGGVRIAKIGGKLVINPDNSDSLGPDFEFEIFAAGTRGKINMIEFNGKEVEEKEVTEALITAQGEIDKLIDFQEEIINKCGQEKANLNLAETSPALREKIVRFLDNRLEEAIYSGSGDGYKSNLPTLKEELIEYLKGEMGSGDEEVDFQAVDFLFEEIVDTTVHKNVLENGKRPDGRKIDEVRKLEGEVSLFKRTHGSAFFSRGDTHALAITTLAPPDAEQLIETMETSGKRRFLLHYNFPPYSVGEIGFFRGPGRREIGHGALAEKAIRPLIPDKENFPYTIRVVSEIVSSNGSSSMATVCASSLSLMDAGVPLKKPVAGIAMGLMIGESGNYKVLTDIQGPEDHHGDMDLKVAGTEDGVTAVQMDVKVDGLPIKIIEEAIGQAKKARLEILKLMNSVITSPRDSVSPFAPSIDRLSINPDKIGLVIGPGGKMINGLIKKYKLSDISIEEDGQVFVSADDKNMVDQAIQEIKLLTKEFKVGEIIEGKIVRILDFGAIVDLGGGKDGMIHVSELKEGFVKNVKDVVKEGDFVRAKIIRVDDDGHIGLSLKQLNSDSSGTAKEGSKK